MVLSGAVIVELGPDGGNITDFTVADGTTISGGNLMIMDPTSAGEGRTAISSSASYPGNSLQTIAPAAGIAAADKLADDGQVNLGLYTTVARLAPDSDGTLSGGMIFGRAMEEGEAGEVIEIKIGGAIL